MNNDLNTSTEIDHHVRELLLHVAAAANDADALCYHSAAQQTRQAELLRQTICRIGWMADLALTKLGQSPVIGGPEVWLLPPSYHWTPGAERRVRHD